MLRLHLPHRATDALSARDVVGEEVFQPLPSAEQIREAVWVDLSSPLAHERKAVEQALGIDLPAKADMTAIEASSRVYRHGNAQFMNVLLVVGIDSGSPAAIPISLVLTPERLVTVRYADPLAFRTLDTACERSPPGHSAPAVLIRLLENVIDRTADILEHRGAEIDSLSSLVFGRDRPKSDRLSTADLTLILRRIGNTQFVLNKVHDSLVTLTRATSALQAGHLEPEGTPAVNGKTRADRQMKESLKTVSRDLTSLSENCAYLTQHVGFLLEAAVGRISVEQTAIVKIFSVLAVVFLPPTLVASIYGMNFEHMPELSWPLGYPMALVMMVLSAVLPYVYFKSRGWL